MSHRFAGQVPCVSVTAVVFRIRMLFTLNRTTPVLSTDIVTRARGVLTSSKRPQVPASMYLSVKLVFIVCGRVNVARIFKHRVKKTVKMYIATADFYVKCSVFMY